MLIVVMNVVKIDGCVKSFRVGPAKKLMQVSIPERVGLLDHAGDRGHDQDIVELVPARAQKARKVPDPVRIQYFKFHSVFAL